MLAERRYSTSTRKQDRQKKAAARSKTVKIEKLAKYTQDSTTAAFSANAPLEDMAFSDEDLEDDEEIDKIVDSLVLREKKVLFGDVNGIGDSVLSSCSDVFDTKFQPLLIENTPKKVFEKNQSKPSAKKTRLLKSSKKKKEILKHATFDEEANDLDVSNRCILCHMLGANTCFSTCRSKKKHPVHEKCRSLSKHALVCVGCCNPKSLPVSYENLRFKNIELMKKTKKQQDLFDLREKAFELAFANTTQDYEVTVQDLKSEHEIQIVNENTKTLYAMAKFSNAQNELESRDAEKCELKNNRKEMNEKRQEMKLWEQELEKRDNNLYSRENKMTTQTKDLDMKQTECAKSMKRSRDLFDESNRSILVTSQLKKKYVKLLYETEEELTRLKKGNPIKGAAFLPSKTYPKGHCKFCGYSFINSIACGVCTEKYLC